MCSFLWMSECYLHVVSVYIIIATWFVVCSSCFLKLVCTNFLTYNQPSFCVFQPSGGLDVSNLSIRRLCACWFLDPSLCSVYALVSGSFSVPLSSSLLVELGYVSRVQKERHENITFYA